MQGKLVNIVKARTDMLTATKNKRQSAAALEKDCALEPRHKQHGRGSEAEASRELCLRRCEASRNTGRSQLGPADATATQHRQQASERYRSSIGEAQGERLQAKWPVWPQTSL